MDYKYIEQLLERYWNSQTTLEEEAILKAFFCQDDIPASLLPYKPLFAYAKAEEENVLGDDFDARMEALVGEPVTVKAKVVTLRQRMMPLFKAAAVVAIILTLGNASQMAFNEEGDDFWRSFSHWIGGMGVLVFIMAIVPDVSGRPMHILRAEMPGPVVGKLVPRIKDTAKILYLIYIALTVLEIVLLLCGGMALFDSVLHAFGTAGTGGFGIRADGLAGYNAYLQWVIAIFMLLFGVNFNLYYLLLIRRFRAVLHSSELMTYLVIALVAAGAITCNIYPLYHNVGEAVRQSVFQVASVITTTGYSTADFNLWPGLSKGILFLLMFIGGCAGSTAGGLKISRVMILMKNIRRQLRHMLHPRSVGTLRMEGKPLDEETVSGVSAYFALCMVCMAAVFLLISFEPFGTESNLTATVACFNNIGPGLGAVGPAGNYAAYSAFSKYVLSAAMLLGRLEIYPLLLVCSPSAWVRNK